MVGGDHEHSIRESVTRAKARGLIPPIILILFRIYINSYEIKIEN